MRANVVSRIFMLATVLVAALMASSCDNKYGIGVGMDYGARWGGTNSPPILVGGPAY